MGERLTLHSSTAFNGRVVAQSDIHADAAEVFERHLVAGGELLRQDSNQEARDAFSAALKIEPDNVKVLALLGLACFRMGDFESALPIYQKLVSLHRNDASHWLNLGLVHLKLNDPESAIEELERSRDLDPSQSRAVSYLGLAYARNGKYAQAYQAFLQAGDSELAREMEQYLTGVQRARIQSTVPNVRANRAVSTNPLAAPQQVESVEIEITELSDYDVLEITSGTGEPDSGDDDRPIAAPIEAPIGAVASQNRDPNQPEAQAETQPEAQPETQPEAQAETQPEAQPESQIGVMPVPPAPVPAPVPETTATAQPDAVAMLFANTTENYVEDAHTTASYSGGGLGRRRAPSHGVISLAVEQAAPSSAAAVGARRVAKGNKPPVPLSEFATARLIRPEDGDHAFEISADGALIIRVNGRMYSRTEGVNVSGGDLSCEVASRHVRGSSTGEDFASQGRPIFAVSGQGHLIAASRGEHFAAVTLDDDILYLREDLVFAFEDQLRWENGHVPGARDTIPMVQFRGRGEVAFRSMRPLMAVKLAPEGVLYIDTHVLAGWIGRVVPRVVSPGSGPMTEVAASALFVECTGEGVVLVEEEPTQGRTSSRPTAGVHGSIPSPVAGNS